MNVKLSLKHLLPRLYSLGLLCLLWGMITHWNPGSWLIGLPAVILALIVSGPLWSHDKWRLQFSQIPGFAIWFLWHSIRGGLDVARRALQPRMPLQPGFIRFRLSLEPGPQRVFLLNCLSLLPGTLSAQLEGDDLLLHTLDTEADILAESRRAELRVAKLFGLSEAVSDV